MYKLCMGRCLRIEAAVTSAFKHAVIMTGTAARVMMMAFFTLVRFLAILGDFLGGSAAVPAAEQVSL